MKAKFSNTGKIGKKSGSRRRNPRYDESYWLKREGEIVDEYLKKELEQFKDMKIVYV